VTEETPSMSGAQACHKWLSYCLSIGWLRETLKGLCDLFWQYHDRDGRLTNSGALRAELADCKSTLAAPERQGDAAHAACEQYETRIAQLESDLQELTCGDVRYTSHVARLEAALRRIRDRAGWDGDAAIAIAALEGSQSEAGAKHG
jgi:hypothetical protein